MAAAISEVVEVVATTVGALAVETMAVVAAVMSGPPQRSPLAGTTGDESPDELNGSTCLETAVGEIPVIKGSD